MRYQIGYRLASHLMASAIKTPATSSVITVRATAQNCLMAMPLLQD
jgi:hypothetical protein